MARSDKIQTIINDLPLYLERDPEGFWEHINKLERKDLGSMKPKDLDQLYADVVDVSAVVPVGDTDHDS